MSTPLSGPVPSPSRPQTCRELIDILVATPRRMPRPVREELASLMVMELIAGESVPVRDPQKFIRRYGIFYPILIHLRHAELWHALKELADDSPETAIPVTHLLVTKIFDLIDPFMSMHEGMYHELDEEMKELLALFGQHDEETQELWGPGSGCPPITPDDEISRLLDRFSGLLARLARENIPDPALDKLCDECSDAAQELEESAADPKRAGSGLDSEEMKGLIDELKEAIDDLKNAAESAMQPGPAAPGPAENSPSGEPADTGGASQSGASGTGSGSAPGSGTGQGEGTGTGRDTGILSRCIRNVLQNLQALKEKNTRVNNTGATRKMMSPSDTQRAKELLRSILQKTTLGPVESMLRPLKSQRKAIGFLAQLCPGKDWSLEITTLKEEHVHNLEKYAKVIARNDELKAILRRIGRTEHEYGMKKRSLSPMGRSEMFSVTRSREISRLLPAEAAKIHRPALKKKFYADFTEGKLLTYNLRGRNWATGRPKKKKGPVVALVDTSGSMRGFPEMMAKSIVFALAKTMLRQDRDVKVILFSGPGNSREIDLTSKKKMADEFLDFLDTTFGGGTDFNTALKSGLVSLKQPAFRGADLLFITDGVSDISNREFIHAWKQVKEEQEARVFSFIIGNDAGGLAPISDYTYFISSDSGISDSPGAAMQINFVASPENPKD